MSRKLNVVSLFSGAGGLDIGFREAGFVNELCVELWDVACDTLKKNNICKKVLSQDIRKINFSNYIKDSVDVVIGGPPCPPFSQTRHYLIDKKKGFEDEESGYAVLEYFRAIKEINPKVFLFENVAGFTHKTHKNAMEYVLKKSDELGYNVSYEVLNCADYGVPQTRQRLILIGVKKEIGKFIFPRKTHSNKDDGLKDWVTCGDCISEFDNITEEEKKQKPGGKHNYLLAEIPPGDNYLYYTEKRGHKNPVFKWKSRYWTFLLKLTPDRPSWTIQASFSTNQGPFHWRNRFLRIEEIMRLQTFPDDYKFSGNFKDQWRQIGNAVPPKLAYILAKQIKSLLKE